MTRPEGEDVAGVQPAPRTVALRRDASAIVTWVEESVTDLLGWRPEELVGQPSSGLIHPDDQNSAVTAWFDMLASPGQVRVWRGRYRCADGSWTWVETRNESRLDDDDDPVVHSTMQAAEAELVTLEEQLRVREQMLSRLADALPVGLFSIDTAGRLSLTNDLLATMTGTRCATTTAELFATVHEADAEVLAGALGDALADRSVDDVEIRFAERADGAADEGAGGGVARVCLLALRSLSDRQGQVTGAIGCLSDVTDRFQMRRRLEVRATTDDLTSCLNRSATLAVLADALEPGRARTGTAVVFLDLDEFKQVNDRLGHKAGDQVLVEASRRLMAGVRHGDHVGRIGGDEFLVVCTEVEGPEQALVTATRLAQSLETPVLTERHEVALRASIGVAWTDRSVEPEILVAHADQAMYRNKRAKDTPATLDDAWG